MPSTRGISKPKFRSKALKKPFKKRTRNATAGGWWCAKKTLDASTQTVREPILVRRGCTKPEGPNVAASSSHESWLPHSEALRSVCSQPTNRWAMSGAIGTWEWRSIQRSSHPKSRASIQPLHQPPDVQAWPVRPVGPPHQNLFAPTRLSNQPNPSNPGQTLHECLNAAALYSQELRITMLVRMQRSPASRSSKKLSTHQPDPAVQRVDHPWAKEL